MGGVVLTNRELASTILLGLGLLVACLSRGIRVAVWAVMRSAFGWKLSLIWTVYATTLSVSLFGLHMIGLGYPGSAKDAIVWGLIVGLPILCSFSVTGNDPAFIRRSLRSVVRTTTVVEFLVNLYVFPLWVELLLQMVVLFIALTSSVARMKPETAPVKKLLDWVAGVIGLCVLLAVTRHLIHAVHHFDVRSAALSFAQPIVLTLLVVILTFGLALVSSYELAFLRIGWGQLSRRRRLRAKLALLATLHVRLGKVQNFGGMLPCELGESSSWRSARQLVRDYLQADATRRAPRPQGA